MDYRADIDGLRAIAILAILLFHAGISTLSGGYIGVDIFFVISGYLIFNIIHREIQTHTFSLKHFYIRRAKRLLPGLFSVIFITSLFAYKILYPIELLNYVKSVLASLLFSANLYFYTTLNYFSPTADQLPLLHLWSLGIEEQFYLFFPLFLVVIHRYCTQFLKPLLMILAISSLILCGYVTHVSPNAAFYLPPLRAFELLIGSITACLTVSRSLNKWVSSLMGMAGCLAISAAILIFNTETLFPGYAALLPAGGAALIIAARQSYINNILEMKPFVLIGKLSYSLYLVHWPLIVFMKRLYPTMPTVTFVTLALLASFVLAYLNYHFIERIFLYRQYHWSTKRITVLSGSIASIFLVIYTVTIYTHGFEKLDKRISRVTTYIGYNPKSLFMMGTCFLNPEQKPSEFKLAQCLPHVSDRKHHIIIWGDSHAMQLYPGLKQTLAKKGFTTGVLTASACPPIIGFKRNDRPYCKAFNDYALSLIVKEKPSILIMTASWPITDKNNLALLEKTIQSLLHYPMKIVLVGESPMYTQDVPKLIANALQHTGKLVNATDYLAMDHLKPLEDIMRKHFAHRVDIQYISIMDEVCPHNACPLLVGNGVPAHFDIAHMTEEGSFFFANKLTPLILKGNAA